MKQDHFPAVVLNQNRTESSVPAFPLQGSSRPQSLPRFWCQDAAQRWSAILVAEHQTCSNMAASYTGPGPFLMSGQRLQ